MLKATILLLALAVFSSAVAVPCTQSQASTIASASDCSVTKKDANTLIWGAVITFKTSFQWKDNSWSNALGDPKSPRLPYRPITSDCNVHPGNYTKGQTAVMNCTQKFDAVPNGYANLVSCFEETTAELDFSFTIVGNAPVSENLMKEE